MVMVFVLFLLDDELYTWSFFHEFMSIYMAFFTLYISEIYVNG